VDILSFVIQEGKAGIPAAQELRTRRGATAQTLRKSKGLERGNMRNLLGF
jgi:hypothetical protein